MNAYCAYAPCGRILYQERHDNRAIKRYCSKLCKGREAWRKRQERQGITVPAYPPADAVRPCALASCGQPLPARMRANALFCSYACKEIASAYRKHQKRRGWWLERGLLHAPHTGPVPARPPVVAQVPVVVAPKRASSPKTLADPCEGYRWVKAQPASFRGVECSKGVFRACNPLGPEGPRLKEAV